jgi:hypothetical protein
MGGGDQRCHRLSDCAEGLTGRPDRLVHGGKRAEHGNVHIAVEQYGPQALSGTRNAVAYDLRVVRTSTQTATARPTVESTEVVYDGARCGRGAVK